MNDYIHILKKAKNLIDAKEEDYICRAICEITDSPRHPLILWVEHMLGDALTLNLWIYCKCGIFPATSEEVRPTRIEWIDAMIAYLERGGKIK